VVDPPILAADRKKENIENPACAGLPDVFRRGEKSFYELIRCYRQLSGATLAKKTHGTMRRVFAAFSCFWADKSLRFVLRQTVMAGPAARQQCNGVGCFGRWVF